VILFLSSCDHGISPRLKPERTGFSGTVIFKGAWPSDVYQTRIVGFRDTIRSSLDFTILNIAFLSDTIPYGISLYEYESDNPKHIFKPGAGDVLRYIVVAQAIVPNPSPIREHWRVAGIYFSPIDSTKYGTVEIVKGTLVKNIDIIVDFNNPPNQPPR